MEKIVQILVSAVSVVITTSFILDDQFAEHKENSNTVMSDESKS